MKIQSNKIKYFIILLIENVSCLIFYILNSLFIKINLCYIYYIYLLLRVYSKLLYYTLIIIINRLSFL